jgi:hypothetical protein
MLVTCVIKIIGYDDLLSASRCWLMSFDDRSVCASEPIDWIVCFQAVVDLFPVNCAFEFRE